MTLYFIFKYLHVLGAIVILGAGAGTACFMLMAHRSGDAAYIARTAGMVVAADILFTLIAAFAQPLTGLVLMSLTTTVPTEWWLAWSLLLYFVAGLLWIPVVFMQIEMRNLARAAAKGGEALPLRYFILFRRWLWFGIPGFGCMMAILWLMMAKPA